MDSSDDDKILPDIKSGRTANETRKTLSESHKKLQEELIDQSDTDSDSDSDLSDSEYLCSVCSKKFSGLIPLKQHEKSYKHKKALLKKKREKELLQKITDAENITETDEDYLSLIKEPYAICKPCGKQFGDAESYHFHMISKTHKQKALQASILDKVRDNGEIDVEKLKDFYKSKKTGDDLLEDTAERIASLKVKNDDDDDETEIVEFECKDCEKSFSGLIPYTQHIMSKVHAKAVKQKKLLQKIVPKDVQHSAVRDVSTLVVEDDILVCKLCSTPFSGPESAMMHLKSRGHAKKLEKYLRKKQRKEKAAEADLAVAASATSLKFESSSEAGNLSKGSSTDDEKVEDGMGQKDFKEISHEINQATSDKTELKNEDSVVKDIGDSLIQYEKYKSYKEILKSAVEVDKST